MSIISFFNKTTMKTLLFLFISIFIIQSCVETNVDFTEKNILAPGAKVLNKIKVIEAGSVPYDINYNWTLGKLTSISTSNNSSSYNLEYNGNDLKKITQTIGQGTQLKTRISNFVYTNGKLTTINGTESSAQGGSLMFTTTISYNGIHPYFISKEFQIGTATSVESIYLEFNNSNISKINYVLGTGAGSINTETNLSNYDDKPNPIHTLPIAFSISDTYLNEDTFGVLGLSTNNYKTANIQNTGIQNTVYTYGTDGYPTKSVRPDLTFQFEYVTL